MSDQINLTQADDGNLVSQATANLLLGDPASQTPASASVDAAVPQIVITEATPLLQSQASPSVDEVAGPTSGNASAGTAAPDSSESSKSIKQKELNCEDKGEASTAAKEYAPCVDPVPKSAEISPSSGVQNTETVEGSVTGLDGEESENMAEDFEPLSPGQIRKEWARKIFVECCEKVAIPLMSAKAIPLWLAFLFLPVSSAVLGGLYFYSCPLYHQFPSAMLIGGTLGSTMLVAHLLRLIRSIWYREKSYFAFFLRVVRDICTILTGVMLIVVTTIIWPLQPNFNDSSSSKFCDRFFFDFSVGLVCASWIITIPVATALIEYRLKRSVVLHPA